MSHLSHSQMLSFQRCGKQYQLQRLQKAPEVPAVWSFAGKALHACIDDINRSVYGGETPNVGEMWTRRFNEELTLQVEQTGVQPDNWKKAGRVSKDKPNKEDVQWWRIDGLRQLNSYVSWLRTSGWTLLGEEEPFSELEVSGQFGDQTVKAFLDAVMVSPEGLLAVVDYKSGTRTPTSLTQLALYSVLLRQTMGLEVPYGSFMMTRKMEMTEPMELSRYSEDWFQTQFDRLRVAIDSELFIPHLGDPCWTCGVADACYAKGGSDAWKYDPDHPQYSSSKHLEVLQSR